MNGVKFSKTFPLQLHIQIKTKLQDYSIIQILRLTDAHERLTGMTEQFPHTLGLFYSRFEAELVYFENFTAAYSFSS